MLWFKQPLKYIHVHSETLSLIFGVLKAIAGFLLSYSLMGSRGTAPPRLRWPRWKRDANSLQIVPDFSFKPSVLVPFASVISDLPQIAFSLSNTCSIGEHWRDKWGRKNTLLIRCQQITDLYNYKSTKDHLYSVWLQEDMEGSMLTVRLPSWNLDLPWFPRLSSHTHVFLSLDWNLSLTVYCSVPQCVFFLLLTHSKKPIWFQLWHISV